MLCLVALAGCFVDRKSSALACDSTADCTGGRTCDQGYCVTDGCPAECTSCDSAARTCHIDCALPGDCFEVDCPVGYACDVTCAAGSDCGNIFCSDGACNVSCDGAQSCGAIDCSTSCSCNVTCAGNGCSLPTCPSGCETADGCDSSGACDVCN